MKYEIVPDKQYPTDWRVEAIDYENEGVGYIAIFAGPDAELRAREYAKWVSNKRDDKAAA
jgi:hypothetical protein